MSWEEDYLMREVATLKDQVAALADVLKEAGMLVECRECTTKYPPSLVACPHCGEPQVQQAVDAGPVSPEGASEPQRPLVNDPKDAWLAYAQARGVEGAEAMTKDQLIEATS